MKRLWISILIILVLVGLTGLHVKHLETLTGELIEQLDTAKTSLEQQDWKGAKQTAQAVYDRWERHGFYLHTTLRHTDIDAIRTDLREILAYLESREDTAECQAAMAKLVNQLELLLEAELPTIKNLL